MPPTEVYTLSLHDALPIFCRDSWRESMGSHARRARPGRTYRREASATGRRFRGYVLPGRARRSEEHTSELQSLAYLVCRLLLEKKKFMRVTLLLYRGALVR